MTDNRNTAHNSYPIPTISTFAKSLKIPETKPLNLHLSSYLVNPQWQHKFIIILLVADLLHLVGPISTMDAHSVVQAQAQSPKLAEPSPSCQSCRQGFTGPRAWALIFGSLRLRLQALGVYTDEFSVIFIVEGLKKFFNRAISLIQWGTKPFKCLLKLDYFLNNLGTT